MTTLTATADEERTERRGDRFRLNRAGILNVWQYDEQEFEFADGRLLLRGANGAGKSKTLEMLLPFVLDGDKARMTASARHHTSLLWLMTDGYDGAARVGYLWVEFARTDETGAEEFFTCGVGIRASTSAKTATAWFFTTPRRVGGELSLEDEAGPMSRPRLVETLADTGQVFDQARAYKEHVGRTLFGLQVEQYDEVLRLLYWLRQPQVGEDIEPARLAGQLLQALPQLDDQAIRTAGDTFDELAAVGEQLDRRSAAATALTDLATTYVGYARAVAAERAAGLLAAHSQQSRRRAELRQAEQGLAEVRSQRAELETESGVTTRRLDDTRARLRQLQDSPEARSQQRLSDLGQRVSELDAAADGARGAFVTAEQRLQERRRRLALDREDLLGRAHGHAEVTRTVHRELTEAAPGVGLVTSVGEAQLSEDDAATAARLDDRLAAVPGLVDAAQGGVGRRQAALTVVKDALESLTVSKQHSDAEDRRAAEAAARWERASAAVAEAEEAAEDLVAALWAELRSWALDPAAPAWSLPETLTADGLGHLPADVAAAAQPVLDELRVAHQGAALERDRAATELAELDRDRTQIERETDPAPPAPALRRTSRPDGAPLWRLVDFAAHLDGEHRAGLEAALQASGLLDAWVRPDGRVLGGEHLDTVLVPGPASIGPHLGDLLVPDLAEDSDISRDVLDDVLRRVAVSATTREDDRPVTFVSTDGDWALGALHGRAQKDRAQYVGATARAEERRRRLEDVRARMDLVRDRLDRGTAELGELDRRIGAVERWVRQVPGVQPVLRAWAMLEERTSAAARDEAEHRQAQERAQEARRELARRRRELEELSTRHDLPHDAGGLAALAERLTALAGRLERLAAEVPGLRRDLKRWVEECSAVDTEAVHVASLDTAAAQAADQARRATAELDELESAVGADVAALRVRLDELRRAIAETQSTQEEQSRRLRGLDKAEGAADQAVVAAGERLREAEESLGAAAGHFALLVDVPGLLVAAVDDPAALDTTTLEASRSLVPGEQLPSGLVGTARTLSSAGAGDVTEWFNKVYRAHGEAATGPAADHEPRLLPYGDLLGVVGRDDGGEHPVTLLATRVVTAVERDRGLLTQRERDQFEQHILGELGDAIRRRRLEAEELVFAMNRLLGNVSTSQGIRVKLDWKLREDVPAEAKEAAGLLTQPIGALLPDERAALRDSLHRLIEVSRAEQPELSYTEHLAGALDYRRWFAFRIRYTRPEAEGRWLDLHRRSPLSQGEQKVLCYLPLFAAAAAHFSSLAGAAPHAPRLVLLDDAFPKIDVRTHPLLFGLLVELDLDFVITSERLWGDHDTLPSLAIYEALRDPSQRGIAQYEFRWDGRTLRAMQ